MDPSNPARRRDDDGATDLSKDTVVDPTSSPAPEPRPIFAWRTIAVCLIAPAAGALLGLVLLVTFILPAIGHGIAQRPMDMAARLEAGLGDMPTAVVLGSSVMVEGLDGSIASEAAPGWRVLNFAVNGAEINEQQVVLPKVLDAGPRVVVLPVRPLTLAAPSPVSAEKAFGYRAGGFPEAWPDAWNEPDQGPALDERGREILAAGPLEVMLHFRRQPLRSAAGAIRVRLRSGVRRPQPDDFATPYELTRPLEGPRLAAHVDLIVAEHEERLQEPLLPLGQELRRAVRLIAERGAIPVLAVVPQHPVVQARTEAWNQQLDRILASIDADGQAVILDTRNLVDADGFADGLHLGAPGRAIFSRQLGLLLATLTPPPDRGE